jgi:hypothetical protein
MNLWSQFNSSMCFIVTSFLLRHPTSIRQWGPVDRLRQWNQPMHHSEIKASLASNNNIQATMAQAPCEHTPLPGSLQCSLAVKNGMPWFCCVEIFHVYMWYLSSFLSNRLTEMTFLYDISIYPKFFSLGTCVAIATGLAEATLALSMFQGHWVHFDIIAKAFLIVTLCRH